jgi:hypothetical protein
MTEVTEKISETIEHAAESKLNSMIALIVAISASLLAIFNIKANNIVQNMSQAQAHTIDSWSYYQSKSTKQNMAENAKDQLQLQLLINERLSSSGKKKVEDLISSAAEKVDRYEKEKNEIKAKAEGFQDEYEKLNIRDDQFDLAEALISLGLSIFGVTALTQKRSLFYVGMAFSFAGVFFGFAGFLGLNIHPEWLTRILG